MTTTSGAPTASSASSSVRPMSGGTRRIPKVLAVTSAPGTGRPVPVSDETETGYDPVRCAPSALKLVSSSRHVSSS
jgi:hypothetical protein